MDDVTAADVPRPSNGPGETGRHNTVTPTDHIMMIAIVSVTCGCGGRAGRGGLVVG